MQKNETQTICRADVESVLIIQLQIFSDLNHSLQQQKGLSSP